MRCWRMRCWDIWRCGGKKKKVAGLWNSVEVIRWVDPETGSFEMNILISKDKKSYFSISDNEWIPSIQAHWDYVSSKWWQALVARFNEFDQTAILFLGGVNKRWEATEPFDWWIGTYTNESMEIFNAFYEDPNEQTLAAFNTFLEEILEEVAWWDYSSMPLHWDNMPQLIINLTYYNEDCTNYDEGCVETEERYSNASTLQIRAEVWDVITLTSNDFYEDSCVVPGENWRERMYIGDRKIYENNALPATVQYNYYWYTDLRDAVDGWYLSELERSEEGDVGYTTVLNSWTVDLIIYTGKDNMWARFSVYVGEYPYHGNIHYIVNWWEDEWLQPEYARDSHPSDFIWTTLSLENDILTVNFADWDIATFEPVPDIWYKSVWWNDFPRLITETTRQIYCDRYVAMPYFELRWVDELLSYDELIVYPEREQITGLNYHPQEYYEKYNNEWRLNLEWQEYNLIGTNDYYSIDRNQRSSHR